MKYKYFKTARKYIYFEVDTNINFNIWGVNCQDGLIRFPRKAKNVGRLQFDTIKQCQDWLKNIEDEMNFEPNKKISKINSFTNTKLLNVTDSDKSIIASMMPSAENYDLENDIRVFESYLANNIKDRDGERFPVSVLKSFAKTIVGKKDLIGHDWTHPGTGKIFKALVKEMTVDETLEFIGGHPEKDFKKHLNHIAEKDGNIMWLVTQYYLPNITEPQKEAVINIEMGIWDSMSIGFRSPAFYAVFDNGEEEKITRSFFGSHQDEDDKRTVLYFEYRNDGNLTSEGLEQSHVGVPAQYGARTSKEYEDTIKSLQKRIEKLESDPIQNEWVDSESIEDNEIKYYVEKLDEIIEDRKIWTTTYINSLPDAAFVVVESHDSKDDDISKNTRHLPHHNKSVVRSTENDSVDLPQLRNALAKVSQVQTVSDYMTTTELKKKSRVHLIKHAKALGVGDYDVHISKNQKRSRIMNFKVEELGVNYTVQEEEGLEDSLKTLAEKVSASHVKIVESKDTEIDNLKTKLQDTEESRDQAVNEMNDFKDKFEKSEKVIDSIKELLNEEVTAEAIKELIDQANAYRESLIEDAIKYACLAEIVKNTEEEIQVKRDELSQMENSVVKFWLNSYREMAEKVVGGESQLLESEELEKRKKNLRLANYSIT